MNTMPCEVGENIYKLRKKNKELLDLLESNSALLENKIKMLRQATRSPTKFDNLKSTVPSSPLKRRFESSGIDSSTLMKNDPSEIDFRPDAALSDNENIPEKAVCDTKKMPAKRIRPISGGAPEMKKPSTRQKKGRVNVEDKNSQKSNACYCSKISEHCKTELLKPKENVQKSTKVRTEKIKNTQCMKEHVKIKKCDSTTKFPNHSENQDGIEMSDVCLKCMDEARRLLNYSPESMFLRRMKQRLQNYISEPLSNDNVKINQICNCENKRTSDMESGQSVSPIADTGILGAENDNQIDNKDDVQDQYHNINSSRGDTENSVHCCCSSKKTNNKGVQFQASKHLIGTTPQDAPLKSLRKKICKTRSQSYLKAEGSKSQKNISKKVTSGRQISSVTQLGKCQCKKQVGGLCCCEVISSADKRNHNAPLKDDAVFSAPLKSSVSAPVTSCLKPSTPSNSKLISLGAGESESEQSKLQVFKEIQRTGYDVIAGLAENDCRKYAADPCTYQLEELSHFREKHWFDCHAHPHGPTTSEVYADIKEGQNPVTSFDDDLMQPTLDPCIRAYRLNQRIFPEVVKEIHSAGCCASQQGNCLSHGLLPTQRRLVTLPSVPHQYAKEASATMKIPPGIEVFPQSNIVICDPTRMGSAPNQSCTAVQSPRRLHRPVPSNSLALRYQKGIA